MVSISAVRPRCNCVEKRKPGQEAFDTVWYSSALVFVESDFVSTPHATVGESLLGCRNVVANTKILESERQGSDKDFAIAKSRGKVPQGGSRFYSSRFSSSLLFLPHAFGTRPAGQGADRNRNQTLLGPFWARLTACTPTTPPEIGYESTSSCGEQRTRSCKKEAFRSSVSKVTPAVGGSPKLSTVRPQD